MNIRINSYIPISTVEGPNKRFVIWVQGCSLKCSGCANSHMWDKNSGTVFDTEDIINLIKKYSEKIEGITFLGGEPLEQIKPVIEISKSAQKMGLTVMLFTGYKLSQIKENNDFQELSKYIDILIDGPFEKEKTDYSRAWVGSSNQNYYFLSDKYNSSVISAYKNKIEVRVDKDKSKIILNGMGDYKKALRVIKESIL